MNITFLFGNGLDLGFGLESGYKSFYPYFRQNASDDNIIKREIEKDQKDNYQNWSDLEVALGKFTLNVSKENIEKFIQDKIELDKLLNKYLLLQEEKFIYDDKQIKNMINRVLSHMRSGNNVEERTLIWDTLNKYVSENYFYQAITFNYTDCVDRIWMSISDESIGSHRFGASMMSERFKDVLHIHGTLRDHEMLIGVNDETQIANTELLDDEKFQWALIKPYLNKTIGQRKIEKAQKIIDGSGIICMYGLSIGITDNIWWEYIGEWLKQKEEHLLMIYNHEPMYSAEHPITKLMHTNQVRDEFLNNTKLDEDDKKAVKSRIIVYDNKNVFLMK